LSWEEKNAAWDAKWEPKFQAAQLFFRRSVNSPLMALVDRQPPFPYSGLVLLDGPAFSEEEANKRRQENRGVAAKKIERGMNIKMTHQRRREIDAVPWNELYGLVRWDGVSVVHFISLVKLTDIFID
jgi:hypothetical protein